MEAETQHARAHPAAQVAPHRFVAHTDTPQRPTHSSLRSASPARPSARNINTVLLFETKQIGDLRHYSSVHCTTLLLV
jgi:hypothetical protein